MTNPKVIEKRQAKQRIDALLVDQIDLVTAGDNPDARVVLWTYQPRESR